jgi:parallel beta-helix repeat protein
VAGGVLVSADHARLEELEVVGGEGGILVEGDHVVLDRVVVRGAELHGIEVVDGSATISDCRVSGLTSVYAQGVEIRNALTRPRTVVSGCTVEGGQEGIVSHVARVEFLGNHVSGTELRGIAVTEMSEGLVEGNTVTGVTGVGLYCGDMSHCELRDNRVSDVRANDNGVRSQAGQAVIAWYHSTMRLSGNDFDVAAPEPVETLQGSVIVDRFPLSVWPPGWRGALSMVPVAAVAVLLLTLVRVVVGPVLAARERRAGAAGDPAARPRRRPLSRAVVGALAVGFAIQAFHMVEHVVQVWQVEVAQAEHRSGLLGRGVDVEWAHLVLNLAVLAFLAAVWSTGRSLRLLAGSGAAWLAAALVVQGYHVVEHVAKVVQHTTQGLRVAPGLLGGHLGLVWFHFAVNLAVLVGTAVAMVAMARAARRRLPAAATEPAGEAQAPPGLVISTYP